MKNSMAGHEYHGLHGCRNVNERVEKLLKLKFKLNRTIDKCECCVSVCSSVCPSVCHMFVSLTYLPNIWFY